MHIVFTIDKKNPRYARPPLPVSFRFSSANSGVPTTFSSSMKLSSEPYHAYLTLGQMSQYINIARKFLTSRDATDRSGVSATSLARRCTLTKRQRRQKWFVYHNLSDVLSLPFSRSHPRRTLSQLQTIFDATARKSPGQPFFEWPPTAMLGRNNISGEIRPTSGRLLSEDSFSDAVMACHIARDWIWPR